MDSQTFLTYTNRVTIFKKDSNYDVNITSITGGCGGDGPSNWDCSYYGDQLFTVSTLSGINVGFIRFVTLPVGDIGIEKEDRTSITLNTPIFIGETLRAIYSSNFRGDYPHQASSTYASVVLNLQYSYNGTSDWIPFTLTTSGG